MSKKKKKPDDDSAITLTLDLDEFKAMFRAFVAGFNMRDDATRRVGDKLADIDLKRREGIVLEHGEAQA